MRRLPLPALLVLAACGGDATAGALATRADSAGIQVVTNAAPAWPAGAGWRIEPTPIVEIGPRPDDDPNYDLLRVTSGRLLPDGGSVLVVAGHRQVRVYDPQGAWLRSIGRDGDGPGEFRSPGNISLAGDTLFTTDFQLSRATAFSLGGELLTSWPYPTGAEGARIALNSRLSDGRWMGTGAISFTAGAVSGGISRVPSTWYLIRADLSAVEDTVTTLAGTERVIRTTTSAGGNIIGMEVASLPVGQTSIGTVAPDGLLAGDSDRPEVRYHAADGTLRRILRWAAPPVPLDDGLWNRLKQADLDRSDGTEEAQARIERRFETRPTVAALPYFSGILRDSEDAVWLRTFAPLPTDSVRFHLFDHTGQWLGTRSLPPRTTVLDIGRTRLLTVWQDDDDLEYVRVYRILREAEP